MNKDLIAFLFVY